MIGAFVSKMAVLVMKGVFLIGSGKGDRYCGFFGDRNGKSICTGAS